MFFISLRPNQGGCTSVESSFFGGLSCARHAPIYFPNKVFYFWQISCPPIKQQPQHLSIGTASPILGTASPIQGDWAKFALSPIKQINPNMSATPEYLMAKSKELGSRNWSSSWSFMPPRQVPQQQQNQTTNEGAQAPLADKLLLRPPLATCVGFPPSMAAVPVMQHIHNQTCMVCS